MFPEQFADSCGPFGFELDVSGHSFGKDWSFINVITIMKSITYAFFLKTIMGCFECASSEGDALQKEMLCNCHHVSVCPVDDWTLRCGASYPCSSLLNGDRQMTSSTSAETPSIARVSAQEPALDDSITTAETYDDQVRFRAYQLYEQRGREDGRASEDWIQAEAEIRRENQGRVPESGAAQS